MNDEPTTINIIINEHHGMVDIIFDLSTGPQTKRIGIFVSTPSDLQAALWDDWEQWFLDDPMRAIRQYTNFDTQFRKVRRRVRNEEDLRLLAGFVWEHGRTPTFNEWEKIKLMEAIA